MFRIGQKTDFNLISEEPSIKQNYSLKSIPCITLESNCTNSVSQYWEEKYKATNI